MQLDSISTANITFYNNYIVVNRESTHGGGCSQKKKEVMLQNQRKEYNGFMSPATKRKVNSILTSWFTAFEKIGKKDLRGTGLKSRRLVFATLTLSGKQVHDDNFIKRNLLNRMLLELRRLHEVMHYFWRAEKQKNGNLHFHLIIDSYVSQLDLQNMWNSVQKDHGYLDDYQDTKGHCNAPSTDIRAIGNEVAAINYVLKYVSKNPDDLEDKGLKVSGRIWGCSKELKALKPYSCGEDDSLGHALNSGVRKGEVRVRRDDFFEIYCVKTSRFLRKHAPDILVDMVAFYKEAYFRLYSVKDIAPVEPPEPVECPISTTIEAVQLTCFDIPAEPPQKGRHWSQ